MPVNKPSSSKEGYSLRERPLRLQPILARVTWMPASQNPCQAASTDLHRSQYTLKLIRVPSHMASWNVSRPSDQEYDRKKTWPKAFWARTLLTGREILLNFLLFKTGTIFRARCTQTSSFFIFSLNVSGWTSGSLTYSILLRIFKLCANKWLSLIRIFRNRTLWPFKCV